MTIASLGRTVSVSNAVDPRRFIPVLDTNTPPSGRLGAQAGSRAWGSEPKLSRTRKWTQPQERRKARMGGDEGRGERVELGEAESRPVVLKGRNVKLPERRASSLALERLRELKRAKAEYLAFSWS